MTSADDRLNFIRGERVVKSGAGYGGPGKVYAKFYGEDGHVRYVVGHTIEKGKGVFYHIYGPSQLTPELSPLQEDR